MLGAGPYLARRDGAAAAFYTHAGNSSTHQAWETPASLLEALALIFGKFDLDPGARRKSRSHVRARVNFTHEDDGLTLPWQGVVFVNPPYGRTLGLWVAKARREVVEGRARTVVAFLPARPDTAYWHEHVAGRAAERFPALTFELRYFECGCCFNGLFRCSRGEVESDQSGAYCGDRGG